MYNVKQYVQSKIKAIRSNYSQLNTGVNESGKSVIYSIAFLNNLLGDTQYFDQEYDNAIVAYLDGLQLLRECKENTFERIILSIKLKLKLGLIYEKMKNNGMALLYFNDAVAEVRRYVYKEMRKNIAIDNQGYSIFSDDNIQSEDNDVFIENSTKKMISYSEVLQVANLPYAASLYLQEKHNVEGINIERLNNYSNDFKEIVVMVNSKDGKNNIVLADHYNDLGNLLYYKNFVFDKNDEKSDSKVNSFVYLLMFNKSNDFKYILKNNSEYNKDFRASFKSFLFYKNAIEVLINDSNATSFYNLCNKGAEDIRYFDNKHSKTFLKTLAFSFSNAGNLLFSITNPNDSNDSMILETYLELWKNREKIARVFETELKGKSNDEKLKIIKKIFVEKESLCSFFTFEIKEKSREYQLKQFEGFKRPMVFWDIVTNHYFEKLSKNIDEAKIKHIEPKINHMEFVIFNYYLAGRFYSKIGKNVSFSFQLRKILQIVRNSIFSKIPDVNTKMHITDVITLLEESLLPMILEATSWNSNATDRPQVYKYKYIEGINDIYHPMAYTKHNYSNISNNSETKEAIFFMADLKVRNLDLTDDKYKKCKTINDFKNIVPEMHLVHPYNGISSQFSRLQEFDLQEKINQALLAKIFPPYKDWEDKLFKTHKRNQIA